MKIVVVVDSLDVNRSSGARANAALVHGLCEAGFDVTVLHYSHTDIAGYPARIVRIRERKWHLFYLLSRTQRILQRKCKIELAPFLERRFGFSFTFFNDVASIRAAIAHEPVPDQVITLSQGGSFRPHAALLQCPHLYDKWLAYVHDPYPFHFYPPPYDWVEPSSRHKESFFRRVTEKARWVGFPSQLLCDWMTSFFPAITGKEVLIPHQLDSATHVTGSHPMVSVETFTVVHAGSLLKQRSPLALLHGFELFLSRSERKADKQLLLVGPADYHATLLQQWEGKPEYRIIDKSVSYQESLSIQKAASVNVILEAVATISPFLPGKFPHCVAAGKPILHIGPANSETMRLLGGDYPYHAAADDPAAIADLLDVLYTAWKSNPERLQLDNAALLEYLSSSHLCTTIQALVT